MASKSRTPSGPPSCASWWGPNPNPNPNPDPTPEPEPEPEPKPEPEPEPDPDPEPNQVPHFEALVDELQVGGGKAEVLLAQGHRWGAAFPVAPFDGGGQFYLDREHAFAACGDYFTAFSGRVEGAWLSGSSLADELLADSLQQP